MKMMQRNLTFVLWRDESHESPKRTENAKDLENIDVDHLREVPAEEDHDQETEVDPPNIIEEDLAAALEKGSEGQGAKSYRRFTEFKKDVLFLEVVLIPGRKKNLGSVKKIENLDTKI